MGTDFFRSHFLIFGGSIMSETVKQKNNREKQKKQKKNI